MKVKLLSSLYIKGVGSYSLGSVGVIDDKIANELIRCGRAVKIEEEKVEKPKTVKKKIKKEVDE